MGSDLLGARVDWSRLPALLEQQPELNSAHGRLQQAKRAARGFRTSANFIAIAYLRMSKLKHLPASPFVPAAAK